MTGTVRDLTRRAHWGDGTQTHHWDLVGSTPEDLDAIDARLASLAPARLPAAACVHDPAGYRAFHRLRAFRRARARCG